MTTTTEIKNDWTADRLNAHLLAGGHVQITTYMRSTIYAPKHAGWFSQSTRGELFVRAGRGKVCLGRVSAPAVGIRLGRVA